MSEVKMSTIDEILNDLGVNEIETTQTAMEEKTASVANQKGEPDMNLQDFYEDYFQDEGTMVEKTAAAENMEIGEIAGHLFTEKVASVLEEVVLLKLAEEAGHADSNATVDAQKGPGVIPSGNVVDGGVMLPVNRPADADQPIDTTPEHYDLLDAAVAKKKIEKAIEKADPQAEGVSFKTVQVDTGLETPKKQL